MKSEKLSEHWSLGRQVIKWWIQFSWLLLEYCLDCLCSFYWLCIQKARSIFLSLPNLTSPGRLLRVGEPEHMEIIERSKKGSYSSLQQPDSTKWQLSGCHLSRPITQTGGGVDFFILFLRDLTLSCFSILWCIWALIWSSFNKAQLPRIHKRLEVWWRNLCKMLSARDANKLEHEHPPEYTNRIGTRQVSPGDKDFTEEWLHLYIYIIKCFCI